MVLKGDCKSRVLARGLQIRMSKGGLMIFPFGWGRGGQVMRTLRLNVQTKTDDYLLNGYF